ncbi:MAG: MerR family transcriptional regulator [Acholeplasmataceae bacterium]|nr:MerR family transcriptional regulator [Acholeplasmataceae bacterium]
MTYTIHELAKLADVSTRTLRYYHQIGILIPYQIKDSGYRVYAEDQIDRLQLILFYKVLGFKLIEIKNIINKSDFNELEALKHHLAKLKDEKLRVVKLMRTVEKTIQSKKGAYIMNEKEKFEGFKDNLIKENEVQYAKEIKEKYGKKVFDESNHKIKQMSKYQYEQVQKQTIDLNKLLKKAYLSGDPSNEISQQACQMHKEWLLNYWTFYTKEAHLSLVKTYVEDERFKKYYDDIIPGLADFLLKAMTIYLENS